MISSEYLQQLQKNYNHLFDIEQNGNLSLKDQFGIPPFKLIFVEGSEFMMGEGNDAHKVKLSPFYMAEFPVTQELYKAIAGNNPSRFEGINHPVETVNWYDAVEFCQLLNQKIGILHGPYSIDKTNKDKNNQNKDDKIKWTVKFDQKAAGFCLPTEAEWEFAARGGIVETLHARSLQYAGSNILDLVGWYNENNEIETKPVGSLFPNKLGLYEMSGNVYEWCWDWYGGFDKNASVNPVGAVSGSDRVLRGGTWNHVADSCRVASCINGWPLDRFINVGFRLAFALQFT